jgi:GNAT superfamily N-acetyltransferase
VDVVADVLAESFADDPVARWVYPTDTRAYMRALFRVFAAAGVEVGVVHIAGEDEAAALWLPFDPADQHDDPEFGEQLAHASGPYKDRLATLDALQVTAHPKDTAHAYLPFIGARRSAQGRGLGGSLLEARGRELDQLGLPAYLEATTLRSASLYERHGFVHRGPSIDLPDGPSLYPMWRKPR